MQRWLSAVSAILGALALLCAYLFYDAYWQYRSLYQDNGRYFDIETAVVYHDTSFYWGLIAIALAGLAFLAYRYRQRFSLNT